MRKEKGNGYLLEYRCDRCRTKFWDKGGFAQTDCPICTPKKLSNHPVITGRSQKEVKCKNCYGRGLVAIREGAKGLTKCSVCNGTGIISPKE